LRSNTKLPAEIPLAKILLQGDDTSAPKGLSGPVALAKTKLFS
jgi:hypothetical protein